MRTPLRCRGSLLLTLPALCLAAAGCTKSPHSAATPPAPPVASVVVEPSRTPLEREVDGTIEAVNQATLSAQTGGRVVELPYDVDDVVPAGSVIVRLKGTEQRASLQGAEAALTEAQARDQEASSSYARIAGLFERRVVSKAQFDQATANRDAAAARLAAAQAAVAAAREGVGYTEIRAPYGAVVTKRLVEVGEAVAPGTPLMSVLSLIDLRVETTIPQSIVMRVRTLKQAAVYVGERRIEAAKITIFPEAATPSSSFRARLDLPPGALDLAPGMYVKVGLVIGQADRLLVPAACIIQRSEVTGVYVLDPQGAASLRYVRVGHRFADKIEILDGLSAGERVALDPVAASARLAPPQAAP